MLNEVFRPIYAKYPGLFRHYMDDVIIMTPLVTLLRALRPDVGEWVTLFGPRYWAGGLLIRWGPGSLLGGSIVT